MIKTLLFIGLGSFLGGMARYLISELLHEKVKFVFPVGTLAVNIIGCFLIGVVIALVDKHLLNEQAKLFLATGVLGGFTTFSAFSHQTVTLIKTGEMGLALGYVLASVVFGIAATFF